MTLTELRYIVALAQERHFGRAAEKCHVAQPTLSIAVKKLEAELGVFLFERAPNEVSPTPAGEAIIAQAERVIAETVRLDEIAKSCGDPLAGPLRIGAIHTIGPYLLPQLVPIIKQKAAQMPLMIMEGLTEQLLEALRNGNLDVAILALPIDTPGIVAQALYDEEFCVVAPTSHPWSKLAELKAHELSREELLTLGKGNCFRDQVLDLCSQAGAGGPQVLEGSSLETIRYMVASGIAPSVMPASAVDKLDKDDPLLRVIPFADQPKPSRRVALAWRCTFPRHQAIDILRSAILECKLAGTKLVKV